MLNLSDLLGGIGERTSPEVGNLLYKLLLGEGKKKKRDGDFELPKIKIPEIPNIPSIDLGNIDLDTGLKIDPKLNLGDIGRIDTPDLNLGDWAKNLNIDLGKLSIGDLSKFGNLKFGDISNLLNIRLPDIKFEDLGKLLPKLGDLPEFKGIDLSGLNLSDLADKLNLKLPDLSLFGNLKLPDIATGLGKLLPDIKLGDIIGLSSQFLKDLLSTTKPIYGELDIMGHKIPGLTGISIGADIPPEFQPQTAGIATDPLKDLLTGEGVNKLDVSFGNIPKPEDLTKGKELFEPYLQPEKILDTTVTKLLEPTLGGYTEPVTNYLKYWGENFIRSLKEGGVSGKEQVQYTGFAKPDFVPVVELYSDQYSPWIDALGDYDKVLFGKILSEEGKTNNYVNSLINTHDKMAAKGRNLSELYYEYKPFQYTEFASGDSLNPDQLKQYMKDRTENLIKTQADADEFEKWFNYYKTQPTYKGVGRNKRTINMNAESAINLATEKLNKFLGIPVLGMV